MAVQLGFGRSVKLFGSDPESLETVAGLTLDRYREWSRAISPRADDGRALLWRLAFSILSVHSPFGATLVVYQRLRMWHVRFGRFPSRRKLVTLLQTRGPDGVVLYAGRKSEYLLLLERQWREDRAALLRGSDSDHDWRMRLVKNVKGLGLAKASFAVALARPTRADVCCIDTHMHRLFTGTTAPKSIGKGLYLELESRVRKLARQHGVNTFTMQWALWDAVRGTAEPHHVLREGGAA